MALKFITFRVIYVVVISGRVTHIWFIVYDEPTN